MFLGFGFPLENPLSWTKAHSVPKRPRSEFTEIVSTPARSLASPPLSDDFYSNLLDWAGSSIFYALENGVFAYDFHNGTAEPIFDSRGASVTALKYSRQTGRLCAGTATGALILTDPVTHKASNYVCHRARIGALAAFGNCVVSGSRDRRARIFDLRTQAPVGVISAHFQEVCGLSLSSDERFLATGGNDNRVFAFDLRKLSQPLAVLSRHRAAVKALAWAPNSSAKLLTGGGTADKTICLWDVSSGGELLRTLPFESQVCNLSWLRNNDILASFGYSDDDIKLLGDFAVKKRFVAHRNRVIHFAVNDDQKYFASASSDSSIKIWALDAKKNTEEINFR